MTTSDGLPQVKFTFGNFTELGNYGFLKHFFALKNAIFCKF